MEKINPKEIKPGFVVVGLGGQSPTVYHEAKDMALIEAERLSMINPGKTFLVCEIKLAVCTVIMKNTLINYVS